MTDTINSWKHDSKGHFIEMESGEQKDYDLVWTDFLAGRSLATITWSIPVGVTKLSQEESGDTAKVWLIAGATAGNYQASCTMLSNGSPAITELFKFRIVVR